MAHTIDRDIYDADEALVQMMRAASTIRAALGDTATTATIKMQEDGHGGRFASLLRVQASDGQVLWSADSTSTSVQPDRLSAVDRGTIGVRAARAYALDGRYFTYSDDGMEWRLPSPQLGEKAIVFDPQAFLAWCEAPYADDISNAEEEGIAGFYDRSDFDAGLIAARAFAAVEYYPELWEAAPRVQVAVHPTANRYDGSADRHVTVLLTVDDMARGGWLIDVDALLSTGDEVTMRPQVAARALAAIADRVNEEFARHRAAQQPKA